jgi:uncharacterized protein (TIGR02757 family)
MEIDIDELRDFLDSKVSQYNNVNFIEPDPISIPHRFTLKEDIEISGFLSATIAWGNRKMITKYGHKMIDLLGESPYDFIMNHDDVQLERLNSFVYRTFNGSDLIQFIKSLQHIYQNHNGLESIFTIYQTTDSLQPTISVFREKFFELQYNLKTSKHVADPMNGSSAKRINLFLRWMIRNDKNGVDFGIWKNIKPSILSCPLDIHSGNIARKLGLLSLKQNNHKAVNQLDLNLRLLDPIDPVKYDFALFGLGFFENF